MQKEQQSSRLFELASSVKGIFHFERLLVEQKERRRGIQAIHK
jgi:hypothetical protein